ncbi:UNVERIFIED_CONTAM: hypothetical protein K2H54_012691, partial [Gekko kuhli]
PGSRDASVQVGVTCEDKATQWEESVEADPSLDKPSGANSRDKASQWEEGVEAEPGSEEAERKPRLDQGPLLPSREKSSGINSKVHANSIDPDRQVLEGLSNGDCGTRKTGLAEGRRERASESHRSEPSLHS